MITLRGKLTRTLVERKSPVDAALSLSVNSQPNTQTSSSAAPPSTSSQPQSSQPSIPQRVNAEGKLVPVITTVTSTAGDNNGIDSNKPSDPSQPQPKTSIVTGTNNNDNAQDVNKTQSNVTTTNNNNDNNHTPNNNFIEEWTWSGIWAFGDLDDNAEAWYEENRLREESGGEVNVVVKKDDPLKDIGGEKKMDDAGDKKEEDGEKIEGGGEKKEEEGGENTEKKVDDKMDIEVADNQKKEGGTNTSNKAAISEGDATKSAEISAEKADTAVASASARQNEESKKESNNEIISTTTSTTKESRSESVDSSTSEQPTKKKKKKKGRPKGWKKKTPEEQAAIDAAAAAAAEAEAMKPRPFEYKFVKHVNPNNVLVPSALVIMVRGSDEEKKSLFGNDYGKKKKKGEGEEEGAATGEGGGEEKVSDEKKKSGDVVMKDAGEADKQSGEAKDGDGDAVMKDNASTAVASTEVPATTTTATKPGPKPQGSPQKEPHPNIQTYGGLPFSDASDTYPTISPKSGKWSGHFENVGATTNNVGRPSTKKKKNTRNHIKEMFYLFFNATPPSTARGVFADSDSTIRANEMLEDKGTTNVEDEKKKEEESYIENLIPKDHVHVRGYGSNRFGTFEIIGSLNPETGVLQCQRMYVPVPTVTEVTKVTGGTQREPYGRFMDIVILDEESEQRKAGSGRKRKTTWKKLLDDTDVVLGPDGIPLPPSTDGKRRRRSGGEPAKKRSRSNSESSTGGSKKKASAGEGGGQLKAPPQCRGEGAAAAAATKPPPSATPATATGSGKRGKKKKDKGGGQASSGGGQQSAAQKSTKPLSGPIRIAPPPVEAPTLPTSGDPVLARWRAAHYLYYQRVEQEPDDELGYNWANGPAASTNASASGGQTSTGAKSGEINPDLVKISYVIYEGEMHDGVRHGKGICLYNNNTLYEGEWKKNKEWGIGKLLTADRKRVIYEGAWEKGKIHGQGTYYYYLEQGNRPPKENGKYVGHFRQGLRNGVGVYTLADGSIYDGEFRDNIQNGYGIFRWPDGSIYEGAWRDGKRHGHGILVASDGFKYEGQWENNTMQGRGVGTYPKGQVYDGTWVAGKREGRGTILFTNGTRYEGRFKEDRMEGQGTMKMSRNVIIPTLASGAAANDDEKDTSSNDSDTEMAEADAKEDSASKKKPKQSWMIPLQFQSDIGHIHMRAGFTQIGL